jgi:3-methyladenine DNA glycosylase AlkD
MVADWRAAATAQMVDGLVAQSDAGTRDHWTRYLKGRAVFRGVPMAGVRRVVRTVWAERALDQHGPDAVLELALSWFGAEATEDKLAGVLLIAEHLAPRLADRHATALGAPLARGDLADWNVVDWYATKAVHAFLTARPDRIAARSVRVARWADAPGLWSRRGAVVAFVGSAGAPPFDGFVPLVLGVCARSLELDDRFAHTGPGWLLRELSTAAPAEVRAFLAAHPELSAEGRRMASARLRRGPYRRR